MARRTEKPEPDYERVARGNLSIDGKLVIIGAKKLGCLDFVKNFDPSSVSSLYQVTAKIAPECCDTWFAAAISAASLWLRADFPAGDCKVPQTGTHVYAVKIGNLTKIGISTQVKNRIQKFLNEGKRAGKLSKIRGIFPATDFTTELLFHEIFGEDRAFGEWFHLSAFNERILEQLDRAYGNGRSGVLNSTASLMVSGPATG